MPIIGKTDAQARDVLNTLQSYVDSTEGLAMLSSRLGVDISKYPLDGPIPDLPLPNTSHAHQVRGATQRQTAYRIAPNER